MTGSSESKLKTLLISFITALALAVGVSASPANLGNAVAVRDIGEGFQSPFSNAVVQYYEWKE